MDEIWDRIKATKIKPGYLRAALISTELLGILVMLWFLKESLAQKFLTLDPKAYSVVSLNPQKRYLLSQADFLVGKAIPNTQVKVLITPDLIKETITVNSKGEWSYQVPENLSKAIHRITFGNFDKSNKLVTFQSYKFRVEDNISLFKASDNLWKKIRNGFRFNSANAQTVAATDFNLYANNRLPNPSTPIELLTDEKFRLEKFFLPYAYPAAQMHGVDWKLMAMWSFREAFFTNYMDNCLDGNKSFGEDADLNQNTPCTGWVNSQRAQAPNWQVGWGIFPWQWVDKMPEAMAVMRPGESVRQIGQRVIDESRNIDMYPSRGIVTYKEPSDPITDPATFPSDVTIEQIMEGAKPLGESTDRSKTCRPDDRDHADPKQDPKDCQMRQLLGILMKDPAISAYFSALMWKDFTEEGNLPALFKTWGPEYIGGKRINPYANNQEVSNTIAAFDEATKDWDLEALKATPQITLPVAVPKPEDNQSQQPIEVDAVISQEGNAVDQRSASSFDIRYDTIPYGTHINDFLVPTAENNVRGVNNINEVYINPEAAANPSNFQLCAILKPVDFDVVIDTDCIPLDQIIDPQILVDSSENVSVVDDQPAETEIIESFDSEATPQNVSDSVTCNDSDWSDKETSGDFICRGNEACYQSWKATPENNCEAEWTGELCELDTRCVEVQQAADEENFIDPALDFSESPTAPEPELQPETTYVEGEMFE